jgi:hypothetical protein
MLPLFVPVVVGMLPLFVPPSTDTFPLVTIVPLSSPLGNFVVYIFTYVLF